MKSIILIAIICYAVGCARPSSDKQPTAEEALGSLQRASTLIERYNKMSLAEQVSAEGSKIIVELKGLQNLPPAMHKIVAGFEEGQRLKKMGHQLEQIAEAVTKNQIEAIEEAVLLYKTFENSFPASLDVLTHWTPPAKGDETGKGKAGKAQFVLLPEALVDPWRQRFLYDPSGPRNGGAKPDIWTITPRKVNIGNWPMK